MPRSRTPVKSAAPKKAAAPKKEVKREAPPKKEEVKREEQPACPAPAPAPAADQSQDNNNAPSDTSTTTTSTVAVVAEEEQIDVSQKLKATADAIDEFAKNLKTLAKGLRAMRKLHDKELREAKKQRGGRRRVQDPTKKRKPSGFHKPGPVSDELCEFLGIDKGTEIARTEVTKMLTKYIKAHDLQNPSDRRQILCNDDLKKLLRINGEQDVTFFNLQHLMKHHYPAKGSSTMEASASS